MTTNIEKIELDELKARLGRIEKAILNEDFDKARILVLGDERLGIPHIRETLKTLDSRLQGIEEWQQRIKWVAAGYGLQGALALGGILYTIITG